MKFVKPFAPRVRRDAPTVPREDGGERNCRMEGTRLIGLRILMLLGQETLGLDVADKALGIVKEFTGFQSVGIWLRMGHRFHHLLHGRDQAQFSESADSTCVTALSGGITTDPTGKPILGCLGERVLRGRTDPSQPFFTAGGTFWTNNILELAASKYAGFVECPLRPQFGAEEYRSIAVIPIRADEHVVGVLDMKDARDNVMALDLIESMEWLGSAIGPVLVRLHAEQALTSVSQERQKHLEEMRLAQERLVLNQQQLELALRAGDMGLWDWNVDTGEVFLDEGWSAILSYAKDELRPHHSTWRSLIHPDDRKRVTINLKRHLTGMLPSYEVEYRLRSNSGEWKWVLDRGKVIERDPRHGRPTRVAGIYFDVTLRKRVEEALHQNEQRLRQMFDAAKDCIYFKDTDLTYTEVNPAMAANLDMRVSKILGRTDEELFGKEVAEALSQSDRLVLKGQTVELEHTRPFKGRNATVLETKVPIRNSDGEVVGIFGICRDITYRKHIETGSQGITYETRSPAMRSVLAAAQVAAQTDSIVLLTGESGVGKDYMARYIHDHSKCSNSPFFAINCAAISPELAESELFGHEPGAFTGAKGSKQGLLELAEGGTILLNEIGELPLSLQSKLLAFLDTRQFTPVGGVKVRSVNARLIAATNQDLEADVRSKRFRKDLFYRLAVFSIEIPPLRDRIKDVPVLIAAMLPTMAEKLAIEGLPAVSAGAMKELASYSWPGNVRELRNVLERALILCDKKTVRRKDLVIGSKLGLKRSEEEWSVTIRFPENQSLNDVVQDLKRLLVVEALQKADGKRKRAAGLLGLTPDALKHYMRLFDLYR